jgi:hypothetical protein
MPKGSTQVAAVKRIDTTFRQLNARMPTGLVWPSTVESAAMTDLDEFKQYYALADKLYEMMSPEQILECLRMLALHLADYRLRFGVVERLDLLELVGATELTDEQTQLLKDGMQLLVGYLGAVRADWDDEDVSIH